jgi:TrmH family RNA methyltransferase
MLVTKSQVKYIQSLGHKKFRDEEELFVVEGPKIVGELLQAANLRPRFIYALREWSAGAAFRASGLPLTEVGEVDLARLSALTTPNQVVAVFEKPRFPPVDVKKGLSLVLDGIQDPGNLGTIVRIADWFGIPRVICSGDSADVFNTKAVQSTMGSISRVQVIYEEPVTLLEAHPDLPVYAAVLAGRSLYEMPKADRGFLVIGNESKGIRDTLLERTTHRVTIPRVGQAESLNAAVATGIILSHLI